MVHILCFGNSLHGDDGFGIAVCRCLEEHMSSQAVRLFEVGLRGIDALTLFDGCQEAILVDALDTPGVTPGTLQVLSGDALPVTAETGHGCGVAWLLQALAVTHRPPQKVTLIGAVIDRLTPFSTRLSPALAAQVGAAADIVLSLLPKPVTDG